MLLVFVDETTDSKFKEYLGLSIAIINARFYPLLKTKSINILNNIGWDPEIEFKGNYLFSKTSGCTDIIVERRIEAVKQLLELNTANSNCRMEFHYGHIKSSEQKHAYLVCLPRLLNKVLKKAPKGAGKNLLMIACDNRSDITCQELSKSLSEVPITKGYVLLEQPIIISSSFTTIGIMFADIVGYLAGRIDTISNDSELFEGLTEEQFENNGKIRKLRSSIELIQKVKNITLYTYLTE